MGYIVSEVAQWDINEIYEFSIQEFGLERTILYLMEMEDVFKSIERHHNMGTLRKHIAKNLYAFPYQSHMIFYHIQNDDLIIITRILHGSRDIPNHLTK
ncbi:toxin ParE1/3/4 [Nonlabens dokdonensis]|jgi:toxin ParE1/3/4|uniref:Toxin ParE1/3/4 n=1 Tax=Nonlabens dokdonensis TaxID=328515 RepID=A0ABX5Q291_9FLAO|nr:toxin ParE1/3/4 [Nonlabens dokdonensis]